MIKVKIFNMKEFLKTVNECAGAVNLLHVGGRRENINKQYEIQNELIRRYEENKRYLNLSLDIPAAEDYMKIVLYVVGDC